MLFLLNPKKQQIHYCTILGFQLRNFANVEKLQKVEAWGQYQGLCVHILLPNFLPLASERVCNHLNSTKTFSFNNIYFLALGSDTDNRRIILLKSVKKYYDVNFCFRRRILTYNLLECTLMNILCIKLTRTTILFETPGQHVLETLPKQLSILLINQSIDTTLFFLVLKKWILLEQKEIKWVKVCLFVP